MITRRFGRSKTPTCQLLLIFRLRAIGDAVWNSRRRNAIVTYTWSTSDCVLQAILGRYRPAPTQLVLGTVGEDSADRGRRIEGCRQESLSSTVGAGFACASSAQ